MRPGRDADHTPASSAEVKKELSYTSTYPMGPPGPVTGFPLPLDALISQIYSGIKLYMFRTVPLSVIRSSFTVHSAIVYVILKFHKSVRTSSVCMCST
jgi:hypothetical protein